MTIIMTFSFSSFCSSFIKMLSIVGEISATPRRRDFGTFMGFSPLPFRLVVEAYLWRRKRVQTNFPFSLCAVEVAGFSGRTRNYVNKKMFPSTRTKICCG
jgi:hypothetical protein